MDYHRIKVRKQSSKCSHSSQCFNKIISRNTLGEVTDGLSSNQSPEAKFKVLAALAMLPDFDSIYRFDMDSGFIFTSLWSNSFADDFMADYIPEAEISMLAPRATLP